MERLLYREQKAIVRTSNIKRKEVDHIKDGRANSDLSLGVETA
jgi:hypothetical protein